MSAEVAATEDTPTPVCGRESGDDDLSFSIPLEVDIDVQRQLFGPFSNQSDSSQSQKPLEYNPDTEPDPTLTERVLTNARFNARLVQVTFATYDGKPACLFVVEVNFLVCLSGVSYRFQDATVEVKFGDGEMPPAADQTPRVVKLAPKLKIYEQTSGTHTEVKGVGTPGGIMSGVMSFGAIPTASYGVRKEAPRSGGRKIQGYPQGGSRVLWAITEDSISKSGIPEICKLAIVARYTENRRFTVSVQVAARAKGGLAVKGNMTPILFNPAAHVNNGLEQHTHLPSDSPGPSGPTIPPDVLPPSSIPVTQPDGPPTDTQRQQRASQDLATEGRQTSLPVHIRLPQQAQPIRSLAGGYLMIEGHIFIPAQAAPLLAGLGYVPASVDQDLAAVNLEELCSRLA
ncbi:hypothetical protein FGG08_002579 [Glutinoglossum americanum]|uniref:Uncharacterized protein n=1 Tax=Glutinoglossum americanum TaxID=1670608 RepID=A0A9P8ICL8_9PEZI|nr:hypothetical protein FGG08_002579 [Glutinoglossum americanum]